jgi:hypothetical protein
VKTTLGSISQMRHRTPSGGFLGHEGQDACEGAEGDERDCP